MAILNEVNPLIDIRVDEVLQGKRQREPDDASVQRVATSMQEHGLLQPIGVTPQKLLIFGATRLAAAKQLGWETIEAREFQSAEDEQVRRIMEWDENDARRELTLEEKLAYKRDVLDPLISDRARKQQSLAGAKRAAAMWGPEIARANFGQAISGDPPVSAGRAREQISHVLGTTSETMRKFENLAKWSEDEALPVEIREAASEARDRANTLGKVDGEWRRVKALKDRIDAPVMSEEEQELVVAERVVRSFDAFDRTVLKKFDAAETGQILAAGQLKILQVVVDDAVRWLDAVEESHES